ncbi:hypothetical protein AAMO2058_001375000 [Amorphochlora amoebiformis]
MPRPTLTATLGLSEIFSYKSLVHACSGATGGVTAISVFFPLNTARIRIQVASSEEAKGLLQTIQDVVQDEGLLALYQGWHSAVLAIGCSNFVYFYTYNLLKLLYKKQTGKRLTPGFNVLIASTAGVANVLLTSPFWTVNTRLVVQRKKSMQKKKTSQRYEGIMDAFRKIYKDEGLAGLWSGVIPSLWLVSNPSVQFVVYERIRYLMDKYASSRGRRITPIEFFVLGAIAKAAATIATYPLQLAQSKLRVDRKKIFSGTLDVIFKIIHKNGVSGLYQGATAKLWQTVLTAAFQFLTYEEVKFIVFLLLLGPKKATQASS